MGSLSSVTSTNWTATNGTLTVSGDVDLVEVTNVDGAGTVSYVLSGAGAGVVTSLGVNAFVLPAVAGASRTHDLSGGDESAVNVVAVASAATHVFIAAW